MFAASISFSLVPSSRGAVWCWRWSWQTPRIGGCPDIRSAFELLGTLALAGWTVVREASGFSPDGESYSLSVQPPAGLDARQFVSGPTGAVNKIPIGSLLRLEDGREFRVERSNGYVISGFDWKSHRSAAVDLRNSKATIVEMVA